MQFYVTNILLNFVMMKGMWFGLESYEFEWRLKYLKLREDFTINTFQKFEL